MRPKDLLDVLNCRPFQPFRLLWTTGVTYELRHPELAIVGKSSVILEFPAPTSPVALAQQKVIVALLHIVQIEILPQNIDAAH